MQIFINSYGAYVHVKDEMFEIKVRQKKEEPEKKEDLKKSTILPPIK